MSKFLLAMKKEYPNWIFRLEVDGGQRRQEDDNHFKYRKESGRGEKRTKNRDNLENSNFCFILDLNYFFHFCFLVLFIP